MLYSIIQLYIYVYFIEDIYALLVQIAKCFTIFVVVGPISKLILKKYNVNLLML